jgi:hypothetical protein
MKRQSRPFTVEIKSSRKPAQKPAPDLTGPPRTASVPSDLWSGDLWERATNRGPASAEALEEANRLFSKLSTPAPVLTQDVDVLPSVPAEAEGRDDGSGLSEASDERVPEIQSAGQRDNIAPNLLVQDKLESGAQPQNLEPRPAHNQRRPQRTKTSDAQPRSLGAESVALDQGPPPQSEPVVDVISPLDRSEVVVEEEPAAAVSAMGASLAKQRRSARAFGQSWAHRAACRKAKRRGKPLPLRSAVRQKSR